MQENDADLNGQAIAGLIFVVACGEHTHTSRIRWIPRIIGDAVATLQPGVEGMRPGREPGLRESGVLGRRYSKRASTGFMAHEGQRRFLPVACRSVTRWFAARCGVASAITNARKTSRLHVCAALRRGGGSNPLDTKPSAMDASCVPARSCSSPAQQRCFG